MNRYELLTLDAGNLLEIEMVRTRYDDEYSFRYDIDIPTTKWKILKSRERHMDNALLFQIRECLKARLDYRKPADDQEEAQSLLRYLIYVDFESVFSEQKVSERRRSGKPAPYDISKPKKNGENEDSSLVDNGEGFTEKDRDELLTGMFTYGITLAYEDGTEKRYLPFDKSANMSRHYMMTFVDVDLLAAGPDEENLECRLSLDMVLSAEAIAVVPSKYYAYRGLYLTDAYRMENSGNYPLNEETVIVLDDDSLVLEDRYVLTIDREAYKRNQSGAIIEKCGMQDFRVTPFDGEGIISPAYAAHLNAQMKKNGRRTRGKATSFQIRMPYTKGMLHQVDFHAFIEEFVSPGRQEILDMFGIYRDLSKAQIILTKSMFKCWGWLKDYVSRTMGPDADPMRYYFEKFHKYNHALYVGNTNLNLSQPGQVKMNYQFLNTLDMDAASFREITKEHIDASADISRDKLAKGRERLLNGSKAQGDEAENVVDLSLKPWEYALTYNPSFVYDPYIAKMINAESRAMLNDTAYGRLMVSGALEYFSHDLLAFLIHMIGQLRLEEGTKNALKTSLLPYTLYQNSFYTADAGSLHLKNGAYYGILRSPHLSRNEQCALKPYLPGSNSKQKIARTKDGEPVNVYVKYFSHLKGVLMVSYRSDAAAALGGADFDGDYVKIITDDRVNRAILQGSYERRPNGMYERKLPIPLIPDGLTGNASVPRGPGTVGYYEELYETTKKTFDNRVGLISNNAIKIGGLEYAGTSEQQKQYENKCALLTIVTGLDLDAVKTGIRPQEPAYPRSSSSFLTAKKFCDSVQLDDYTKIVVDQDDNGTLTVHKKGETDEKAALTVRAAGTDRSPNIDMLPHLFFKEVRDYKVTHRKPSKEESAGQIYFSFQKDAGWRAEFEDRPDRETQGRLEDLKMIRAAYSKLNGRVFWLRQIKENRTVSNNVNIVHNILRTSYGEYLPGAGTDIHLAADIAYLQLKELLPDRGSVSAAIKRMEQEYWPMLSPAEKEAVLPRILGIADADELDPSAGEVLLAPRENGHKILQYLLLELKLDYESEEKSHQKINVPEEDPDHYDAALYKKLTEIYNQGLADRKQSVLRTLEIRDACIEAMKDVFGGDLDMAFRYCFYLREKAILAGKSVDQGRSFFWEMFDTETIAVNLAYADETAQEDKEAADA